jgi:uncharacterized protein YsxB (DUF464 family)
VVEVTISEDSRGRLSSFSAQGHAGWAQNGSDVVCAAVSALLQAAWLGLTDVVGVEVNGERSSGSLTLSWPKSARERADVNAIVSTAAVSIEHIAAQFPAHVRAKRIRESAG